MTEITKNITVDLSRKGNTRIVFARQNDKGSRTLNITLTDGGAPYFVPIGTVATINVLRPDNEKASFAATVNSSGGVTYTLGLWTLAVEGSVRCSVSLYGDDDTKLTSSDFYLDVLDALYSDDDFSEDVDESAMTSFYSSLASLEAKVYEDLTALEDKHDDEMSEAGKKLAALENKHDAEMTAADQKITAINVAAGAAANDAQTALNIANSVKAQADSGAFKGEKGDPGMTEAEIKSYIDEQLVGVEAALDSIIAIQSSLIGGEAE